MENYRIQYLDHPTLIEQGLHLIDHSIYKAIKEDQEVLL